MEHERIKKSSKEYAQARLEQTGIPCVKEVSKYIFNIDGLDNLVEILPIGFQWDEFDYWFNIFNENRKFPPFWKKHPLLLNKPFSDLDLSGQLNFFTIPELKKIAKSNEISLAGMSKKDDILNVLLNSLTLENILNSNPELYSQVKNKIDLKYHKAKCGLLYQYINAIESNYFCYHFLHKGDSVANTYLKGEVELEYIEKNKKDFGKTLPPYFVGDQTNVVGKEDLSDIVIREDFSGIEFSAKQDKTSKIFLLYIIVIILIIVILNL